MRALSQHLSELSNEVRTAEDRVAEAQSEAGDRLEKKREQVRREIDQALEIVRQRVEQSREETRSRFDNLHAKLSSDLERLKETAIGKFRRFEAWQANNNASDKELDALAAIDYAIVATKIAELQTLEAIAARAEARGMAEEVQVAQPLSR